MVKNLEKLLVVLGRRLKAVWHRGAVDADGKSGDGAGIKLEISPDFSRKIISTGHSLIQTKEYVLE